MKANKQTVLLILDGYGIPQNIKVSAITKDNTHFMQSLAKQYGYTALEASEEFVGLPDKQVGTSDVGHLTIGSGRTIYQPLVRINKSIKDGTFAKNKVLLNAVREAKEKHSKIHILGLISDGGVHSHIQHLYELLKFMKMQDFKNVCIHAFADGRDTPIKSVKTYLKEIEEECIKLKTGEVVSLIGRAYALDRDKNWDRVKLSYDLLFKGLGTQVDDFYNAIDMQYEDGITDEFLKPIHKGETVIKENDVVIIFNYRADRERQLSYALKHGDKLGYTNKEINISVYTMTNYDNSQKDLNVLFDEIPLTNILSEVLSNRGYRQFKTAETEKYAYVTFAMNAGRIEPFKNEDREIVSSVKLESYASCPEMSARKVSKVAINAISSNKYDFVAINIANPDMVGHSGNFDATKKAIQVVDEVVKEIVDTVLSCNARIIIVADHGNADTMKYADGTACSSHSVAKVPFMIIEKGIKYELKESGTLADVAPTILDLFNEKQPKEMTGRSLIVKVDKL
ncbi:MAG: 2,3-bisphosphoglycerate-independent phosphoglycerate mutase [Clostridia bacterium]